MRLRVAMTAVAFALGATAAAQPPPLDLVLSRLHDYLDHYDATLSPVIAEERYTQTLHDFRLDAGAPERSRVLVSDYSPARAPGGQAWTGFRDTFEVDGTPVRDREDRLAALLADGSAGSAQQALRITRENARHNLGAELVARTINVPTVALDILHRRHRDRFDVSMEQQGPALARPAWMLRFRERRTPTLLRTPDGRDRRSHGTAWIDPATGEVLQTTLSWEGTTPSGRITVVYRHDAHVGALVPDRMLEEYQGSGWTITGEAVYTHYRRFETGGRILSIAPR